MVQERLDDNFQTTVTTSRGFQSSLPQLLHNPLRSEVLHNIAVQNLAPALDEEDARGRRDPARGASR